MVAIGAMWEVAEPHEQRKIIPLHISTAKLDNVVRENNDGTQKGRDVKPISRRHSGQLGQESFFRVMEARPSYSC
jgi:hypothetical protein